MVGPASFLFFYRTCIRDRLSIRRVDGPLANAGRILNDAKETIIAKGQKTTHRETRKSKAVKAPTAPSTVGLLTRGALTPVKMPRQRH